MCPFAYTCNTMCLGTTAGSPNGEHLLHFVFFRPPGGFLFRDWRPRTDWPERAAGGLYSGWPEPLDADRSQAGRVGKLILPFTDVISLTSSWTCLCNVASSSGAALFSCRCKYAAASPGFFISRTTSRPRAMLETTVCSLWSDLFDIVIYVGPPGGPGLYNIPRCFSGFFRLAQC